MFNPRKCKEMEMSFTREPLILPIVSRNCTQLQNISIKMLVEPK